MARPFKQGLDYFPLDVAIDDKVKMIDAKFGVAGFGILIKLWQIIYDNSYFIKWTEREVLLYKNRINADINLINDIINECIKWDLFNPTTYKEHGVLTSRGIQKRYLEAIKRRHKIVVYLDYWEIDVPENTDALAVTIVPKAVNHDNNLINDDNNSIDSYSGTQSKGEEIRGDKRRAKKEVASEAIASLPPDLRKTVLEFADFRKKLKKPMTDRAIELLVTQLFKLSDTETEQMAILNQSIMNGWTSIYPLKDNTRSNQQDMSAGRRILDL